MSIVKRTTIIIICASLALFLLAYFATNYFYLRGFGNLERKTIEKNTLQVTHALTVELKELGTFCEDWASWDDTYYFAQNRDQEYIDRNLMDATFNTADLSLFG